MIIISVRCKLIVAGKFIVPFFFFLVVTLFACNGQQERFKNPRNYSLEKPHIIKLPVELDEISGIAYYRKDNSIFCESDEYGNLYKIFLNNTRKINKWKFGKAHDYEDVVLHDSVFYILNSNGDIAALRFQSSSITSDKYEFPEKGKFEFESLYYEPQMDKLVLICKDCGADERNVTSTYVFDYRSFTYTNGYTIDARKVIEEAGSNKSGKFKPSAAAIHPIDGKLYIISSVNKALVIADRNGNIQEIYRLDPEIFQHPEGITFNAQGGMFISNEAETPKPANILFYEYKRTRK